MNGLPLEVLECVLHHLGAYDAHRFERVHHGVRTVLTQARVRARTATDAAQRDRALFDRWYEEVNARFVPILHREAKAYAEDPENEYGPRVREALIGIHECSLLWEEDLWDMVTGGRPDYDLQDLAIDRVETEVETYWNSQSLRRCDGCDLLHFVENMSTWDGSHSWPGLDKPQCLECEYRR